MTSRAPTPWTPEEVAWARDCLYSGDTIEEIAAAAGRLPADVRGVVGSGQGITAKEREVLSLYAAGCSFPEIDAERGVFGQRLGKAAAACITNLRSNKGLPIPYRNANCGPPGRRKA